MTKQISYKCVKCGNCCHAGLEISIREIDLKKWIDKGENDFIDKIQIDPKSISPDGLAGYHIEEKNALLALLKQFNDNEYQIKKKELKQFILENHDFLGNGIYPIPIRIEKLSRRSPKPTIRRPGLKLHNPRNIRKNLHPSRKSLQIGVRLYQVLEST